MALVSHLHSDHFDPAAQELLPKSTPIFCQPEDKATIETKGFSSVTPVTDFANGRGSPSPAHPANTAQAKS